MDVAPEDKLAVMSLRAAANQFGHLLGAAVGGLALQVGGFPGLGAALAVIFVGATLVRVPWSRMRRRSTAARQIAAVRASA